MSEKQGKGKKRPKSYYLKCAHKKVKHGKSLDINMAGFLVTCNGNEKQAVREMYNLLNEYADKLYGPEDIEKQNDDAGEESESGEEDIEEAMKKEVDSMKEVKTKERRFQNINTKSRNTIFIKTTLDDPVSLAHSIMSDIYSSGIQKSRFAIRMLPIERTCKCRINEMEALGKSLFKKYFETPFGTGLGYTTVFTKRNNTDMSRETVIPKLGNIIKAMNPLHRVDHVNPDYVVLVEIIGNVCCLSVLKDFFKFKKYNLIEVSKQKNAAELQNKDQSTEEGKEVDIKVSMTENGKSVSQTVNNTQDEEIELNADKLDENEADTLTKELSEQNTSTTETLTITNESNIDSNNDSRRKTRKRRHEEDSFDFPLVENTPITGSMSRETTVIMGDVNNEKFPFDYSHRTDTVVMESLPVAQTVVMESLDRNESLMDAMAKGESIMEMGTFSKDESTMEVLNKGESVMDSF